jgi:transposase
MNFQQEKKMVWKKGHTYDDYIRCAAYGMSKAETARLLGVTIQSVHAMALRYNITFELGYRGRPKKKVEDQSGES